MPPSILKCQPNVSPSKRGKRDCYKGRAPNFEYLTETYQVNDSWIMLRYARNVGTYVRHKTEGAPTRDGADMGQPQTNVILTDDNTG